MSAAPETLRALRMITIAWWVATLRSPLRWAVDKVLYSGGSYDPTHRELVRVINAGFSLVGIGCAILVIVALTRLGDWRRANVWVRAAWGAFIAQASIASFTLVAWIGLSDVIPSSALEVMWMISTVIHVAAPTLLILVLHRARHPQGWAVWLWPLLGWIAAVDLGLSLVEQIFHWYPFSGAFGELMSLVLNAGSDVAILLLLHDVHARLSRADASSAPGDAPQATAAAWSPAAAGLSLYARALGWRIAIGVAGAVFARLAGAGAPVVMVLTSIAGLVAAASMLVAMAKIARAPSEANATNFVGGALAASGLGFLADLYSLILVLELATNSDSLSVVFRVIEQLPWVAGLGSLTGVIGSLLFLGGLARIARALRRPELATGAGLIAIAVAVTTVVAGAGFAMISKHEAGALLGLACMLLIAAIWILVKYFSLLKRLGEAASGA
jgi:hypothetical protein